jgi:hypothetical protein
VTAPLDVRTLLARIDHRIRLLRGWLAHDHRDAPFWWARKLTARDAQSERARLRAIANLLHVVRASERGRLHGTRFVDLDAQRAWLATMEQHRCPPSAALVGLPGDATLAMLRAGEVRS